MFQGSACHFPASCQPFLQELAPESRKPELWNSGLLGSVHSASWPMGLWLSWWAQGSCSVSFCCDIGCGALRTPPAEHSPLSYGPIPSLPYYYWLGYSLLMSYPRLWDVVQLERKLLSPTFVPSGLFWEPLTLAQNDKHVPELVVVNAWPPAF